MFAKIVLISMHVNTGTNNQVHLRALKFRTDPELIAQFQADGHCHICFKPEEGSWRRHAIDHDHETGEVRGYLCDNCNKGLGVFQDNVNILTNAVEYLLKSADRRLKRLKKDYT